MTQMETAKLSTPVVADMLLEFVFSTSIGKMYSQTEFVLCRTSDTEPLFEKMQYRERQSKLQGDMWYQTKKTIANWVTAAYKQKEGQLSVILCVFIVMKVWLLISMFLIYVWRPHGRHMRYAEM